MSWKKIKGHLRGLKHQIMLIPLILIMHPLMVMGAKLPPPLTRLVGVKFLYPEAYYAFDPKSCYLKNKNSAELVRLYQDGERNFQQLANKVEQVKWQEEQAGMEQEFQGRLAKLQKEFLRLKNDKVLNKIGRMDDALGVQYLILLAERFEISALKIEDKLRLYRLLLQKLSNPTDRDKILGLERAVKVLEGTKEVYQAVAQCHRNDSLKRKVRVAVPKDFGFLLHDNSKLKAGDKNIFETSWESYRKTEEKRPKMWVKQQENKNFY